MAETYVDETPGALTEAASFLTGGASEEPPRKRSKSSEEIAPSSGTAPLPTPLPTPGLVGIAPVQSAQSAGIALLPTPGLGGGKFQC